MPYANFARIFAQLADHFLLRLVKNHFAGPANQCYKAMIEELDVRPPGICRGGFFILG